MAAPYQLLTLDCAGRIPRVAVYSMTPSPTESAASPGLISPVAADQTPPELRSAASLMPLIQSVYQTANLEPSLTTAIAVTYGPGSFTSLRIGITTAKTLAYCWSIPTLPINTLDLMLAAGILSSSSESSPSGDWDAAIHAYRGQVFCKRVRRSDDRSTLPKVDWQRLGQQFQCYADQEPVPAQTTANFQSADEEAIASRFELQEERIRVQESCLPDSLWHTAQSTDALQTAQWIDRVADSQGPVVVDQPLKDQLSDRWSNCETRCRVPSLSERDQAFGWLACLTATCLDPVHWNPLRLQPIYYRPSAAEESLGMGNGIPK